MGFITGGLIFGVFRDWILLGVVVVLFAMVATVFTWNIFWGRRTITDFIGRYPDVELRTEKDEQSFIVSVFQVW
ncbi:hypothetical protein CASFOL_034187 [Castilleja foliolosa]|uniref:Uncharacterized protein n=1 Tax=Castilleja foliolosa TaxID=1961234 RepID=A0ABD3BY11_9LAMI